MKRMTSNLPISADAQKSIKAFFYHFCKYMEENYCATLDQLMLDWNSVGATARFIGNGCNIQYRLWERSEGHLNLPDMTMIVETVVFDRKLGTRPNHEFADRLRKEMNAFSKWLILTARICGLALVKPSPCFAVKYVADPNMPPIPDENVPGCPLVDKIFYLHKLLVTLHNQSY